MALYDENGRLITVEAARALGQSPKAPEAPAWFEPGSQSEAITRGLASGATLGLGPLLAQKLYGANEKAAQASSAEANPWSYGLANAVGAIPTALVTGAATTLPKFLGMGTEAIGGGLGAQMAKGAVAGGITGGANSGDLQGAAIGAGLGGALPGALPGAIAAGKSIGKVVGKGLDYATTPGIQEKASTQIADQIRNISPAKFTDLMAGHGNIKSNPFAAEMSSPKALADFVETNGARILQDDQLHYPLSDVSKYLIDKAKTSPLEDAKTGAMLVGGLGAGLGAFGGAAPATVTGALGALAGSAKAIPSLLVNREIKNALSPTATQFETAAAKDLLTGGGTKPPSDVLQYLQSRTPTGEAPVAQSTINPGHVPFQPGEAPPIDPYARGYEPHSPDLNIRRESAGANGEGGAFMLSHNKVNRATVRVENGPNGEINVTDLSNGDKSGLGSDMLASGLKEAGLQPGQPFNFTTVINKPTVAYKEAGLPADTSQLGKTAQNALNKLGYEAGDISYGTAGRGKLSLNVQTTPQEVPNESGLSKAFSTLNTQGMTGLKNNPEMASVSDWLGTQNLTAKSGTNKITSALQQAANTPGAIAGTGAAKFGLIANMLNQTDPEARAAMNEDNPLNSQD